MQAPRLLHNGPIQGFGLSNRQVGSDLIEGLKGPVGVDDSSLSEELQVTVDLLG